MHQCVEDLNTSSPPFIQIQFFFFFHRSSSRSCYHIATTARGSPPQPMQEGRLQPHLGAREPPRRRYLFPLAPTPTAAATACIRRYASKVIFFFSFFRFFSDHCRDLFFPHARSSNPHLSPVPRPSSLASPAAAIASFVGTQVKICFFFSFFRSFSDQCYRDPLYPTCRDLKPPPLHHIIPIPMSRPSSLASPHRRRLAACKL